MAHTDYVKMNANHKARRLAEKQDMRRERLQNRVSLLNMKNGISDPDNSVFVDIHKSGKRCFFCGTPGFWCSC